MMAKYIALELNLVCAFILISLCGCQPKREREKKETKLFTLVAHSIALVLIAEGATGMVNGVALWHAVVINKIATFISYLLPPIICLFWVWYVIYRILGSDELIVKRIYLFALPAVVAILQMISNPFFHTVYYFADGNIFTKGNLFIINEIVCFLYVFLALCLCLYKTLFDARKKCLLLSLPMILPVAGYILQHIFNMGFLTWPFATISLIVLHLVRMAQKQNEQFAASEDIKKEVITINETVIKNMIQPHFLFNALSTICYLCETKPKEAEKTIQSFATFLRTTLNSTVQKDPIPFTQEIELVKSYMVIEKYRFPFINIEYDIECATFKIPAVTVQPLVHNAIRFGLCPKQGGLIKIHSFLKNNNFYVTIIDDGQGFDPLAPLDPSESHNGIKLAKERLASMCNGTLTVQSAKGEGTVVTITIPNIEQKNN